MHIIETDRLFLSELSKADAPFILTLTNSAGWLQYIGDRGIKNTTDAENYIINGPMASYAALGHGLWLVSLKSTGEPLGICGIIKRNTLEDKDIGFAFLPQYTGYGYAHEAAAASIQFAKNELAQQRIVAITLPANSRSINLLTKLGFVFEKMIRFDGGNEDLMLMAAKVARQT